MKTEAPVTMEARRKMKRKRQRLSLNICCKRKGKTEALRSASEGDCEQMQCQWYEKRGAVYKTRITEALRNASMNECSANDARHEDVQSKLKIMQC